MRGLSLVAASRGYSSLWCTGFSLSWLLLLLNMGSRCSGFSSVAHGLSCSAACGNLPGPGLEPVSPALAGGFLTTVPPGKPYPINFLFNLLWFVVIFLHCMLTDFDIYIYIYGKFKWLIQRAASWKDYMTKYLINSLTNLDINSNWKSFFKKWKKIRKGGARRASWQATQSSSISLWDCIKRKISKTRKGDSH